MAGRKLAGKNLREMIQIAEGLGARVSQLRRNGEIRFESRWADKKPVVCDARRKDAARVVYAWVEDEIDRAEGREPSPRFQIVRSR